MCASRALYRLLENVSPGKHNLRVGLVAVDFDVVIVDGIGRIESHNTAGREPATFDDLLEHRLAFGINLARLLAHDLVVQDGGILAEQATGLEKRRPVKELHHLRQDIGRAPGREKVWQYG